MKSDTTETQHEYFELHAACKAMPKMKSAEFKRLCDSIAAYGQIDPVLVVGGKIIDGRHRQDACRKLGIAVEYWEQDKAPSCNLTEESTLRNVFRRHLSAGQIAAQTVEGILPKLAAEAKRRRASGKKADAGEKGSSTRKAAKMAGASQTYVKHAKKMKDVAPETFDDLKTGKKTMAQATKAAGIAEPLYEQLDGDIAKLVNDHLTAKEISIALNLPAASVRKSRAWKARKTVAGGVPEVKNDPTPGEKKRIAEARKSTHMKLVADATALFDLAEANETLGKRDTSRICVLAGMVLEGAKALSF